MSHNQLESLSGIQSLVNLTGKHILHSSQASVVSKCLVLNAGHNKINTVGNISALKGELTKSGYVI